MCILSAGRQALAQSGTGPVPAENGEPGFYYTIQKGDTLWDLSRKFYNSQWDWPGLWEMNKDIKNPHWIYPGKKIRVYLKSQAQIPALPAPETAPQPAPVPDPIIPTFVYPEINKIGFIKKTAVKSLGEIIRERDGNLMMSSNDIIYIRPADTNALVPGQIYHIFNVEPVKEKFNKVRFRGIKHLIKSEVEILENKNDYSVGKIRTSYRDATVGDMIMPFPHRDHELKLQKNPEPITALIVCSEDSTVMINDFRVAFINKGTKDRIIPGQIYDILQTQDKQSFFDGADAIHLAPLFSGKLIVLHTEDISSTVMVLSSKRDIHPGDMVR